MPDQLWINASASHLRLPTTAARRLCRQGKARISREVVSILDRLGTSAEVWGQRIQRLLAKTRLLGSYFSADRQRLRQLAQQRGVHQLDNVAGSIA
jgi:hypothetical protein